MQQDFVLLSLHNAIFYLFFFFFTVCFNPGFVKASKLLPFALRREELQEIVDQLKRSPTGLDAVLSRTVPQGVGFHHAGIVAYCFQYDI